MNFNINICHQYLCSNNVAGKLFSSGKCYFRNLTQMVMVTIMSIWMDQEFDEIQLILAQSTQVIWNMT